MSYGNYPDLKTVKRVLVVKMRHHGDVLLTSPVFSCLKNSLIDSEIDALIYKDTYPMLEGHPAISECLFYDRNWKRLPFFKRVSKELSLLRTIRRKKYDMVINLTEGDRGAIVALIAGARVRVGFDPGSKGLKGKRKIYTHLVKNCPTPRHTVERQLDVLRRIGIFPDLDGRDLTLYVPDEASARMRYAIENGGISSGDYIVLHPVSRWRFKCPPAANIAKIIDALNRRGEKVVITSGPDAQEVAMVEEILALVPKVEVLNLSGKTSLKDLSALIQMSKCLICVDSVPLHISSALKTPVIVLFGPSSEQNWGPWRNPQSRVVSQKMPCQPCYLDGCGGSKVSDCLSSLPVKAVMGALESLELAPSIPLAIL
jgi:heptosyltransferase III